MGVYWEFVIFTISKYPNGKPLAMFTKKKVRPLKSRFLSGFFKLVCLIKKDSIISNNYGLLNKKLN